MHLLHCTIIWLSMVFYFADLKSSMASSSSKSEENKERIGDGFRLADLPDDLLRETLLKLPAQELVKSCMLVSKKWQNFVDSPAFWKEKCKLDLSYTDAMLLSDSGDFKKLYFQNPYSRNLIQNSRADEGMFFHKGVLNSFVHRVIKTIHVVRLCTFFK